MKETGWKGQERRDRGSGTAVQGKESPKMG